MNKRLKAHVYAMARRMHVPDVELNKFQFAVEHVSDQVIITDSHGVILYVNPAVCEVVGFPSKQVIGTRAGELWGGLMARGFYDDLWRVIRSDKKTFAGELVNRRKNGETYEASLVISPVLNKKGGIVFFVAIERDITKEKEIDRAKTEFVSLASHQLRTPPTAIRWYVEMLLNERLGRVTVKQKQYLQEIDKSNKRMVRLVNALLNVSRIELGSVAIRPKKVCIADVVDSVLGEFSTAVQAKSLVVYKRFDADVPFVRVDSDILHIVLQNLISNAVKYSRNDGVIRVSVRKKNKDVVIIVSDKGCGIPDTQQSKVFTRFFRADNVVHNVSNGTGLGLYIVKSLTEQYGGRVWFHSCEGAGTTFYVTIPLFGMQKRAGDKGIVLSCKEE